MADAPAALTMPRRRRRLSASTVGVTLALLIGGGLFLFPALWMLVSSFKPGSELFRWPLEFLPEEWTFANYARALESVDFVTLFRNTIITSTVTTVLTVFMSALTGYALAKYRSVWTHVIFILILITTMLPTEVLLSPTFTVINSIGLYDKLPGIILPSVLTASGVFMFRQFYRTVPTELIEAARIDGAREITIFLRIMFPLSKPIAITLAIFSFQWRWNDYIWPLIVLSSPDNYTMQIGLRNLIGAESIDWTIILPASIISMIPMIVLYLVFQRQITNAGTTSGVR